MAAGEVPPLSQPQQHDQQQPSHRGAPPSTQADSSVSPPTKRELASWWRKFRKTTEKTGDKENPPGIFGIPLADSIRYANVAISLSTEEGESFIYGYVPIVVAKCGVFLKEKATDVEGIFRVNGSAKRINDLEVLFDSPPRYGKGLDWTGYNVHDAANIFRRYLNRLPEPIVPLEFYEQFRDPLRSHQVQAIGQAEAKGSETGEFDHDGAVRTYQRLITELPPLNRQLLLYVLDLLAVFASKAELNLMDADNLASIFQPGILSHPSHDMAPEEYRLSRIVLIFLILNQDNFLFGMSGTAVDEKTVKDMEQGLPPANAASSSPKVSVGRSASNASGGADSLRRRGRRPSASSRHSRGSTGPVSPGTPVHALASAANVSPGSGVHRSNTVPTQRSPALGSARFQRPDDQPSPGPATPTPAPSGATTSVARQPTAPQAAPSSPALVPGDYPSKTLEAVPKDAAEPVASSKKKPSLQNLPASLLVPAMGVKSPTRERKISSLFSRSPISSPRDSDSEQREARQRNKLRKRPKIPGSANESAQSSQHSLQGDAAPQPTFYTPLASPDLSSSGRADPLAELKPTSSSSTATATAPPASSADAETTSGGRHAAAATHPQQFARQDAASDVLKPPRSPVESVHSRSSYSDIESSQDGVGKSKTRRSRWRFTKPDEPALNPPPPVGQHIGDGGSNSSFGSSSHRPRKSFTGDSQQTQQTAATTATDTVSSRAGQARRPSQESSELTKDNNSDVEKKSIFGKLKAKIAHAKDDKKDRETEKSRERARTRSPAGSDVDGQNLTAAMAGEPRAAGPRARSIDLPREKNNAHTLPSVRERLSSEGNTEAGEAASAGPDADGGARGAEESAAVPSPVPATPITAIRTDPTGGPAASGSNAPTAGDPGGNPVGKSVDAPTTTSSVPRSETSQTQSVGGAAAAADAAEETERPPPGGGPGAVG